MSRSLICGRFTRSGHVQEVASPIASSTTKVESTLHHPLVKMMIVLRVLVLLLALPSLLMPPGLCICRFVPTKADSTPRSMALKAPQKKACCNKCGKDDCNHPTENRDKSPGKVPDQKPDCCLVKMMATQPTVADVGTNEVAAMSLDALVVTPQTVRISTKPPSHIPAQHSPPYITFCALLI